MEYFILAIVLAYVIGSIPTAVWVGRLFYGKDVRNEGSGNAGATNTIRVLGLKAGIPVLLMDVFKGFAAVWLAPVLAPAVHYNTHEAYLLLAAAAAVVLGHTFPLFAGFRGGKGVATLLGVGFGLYPFGALVVLGIFIVILSFSHYVSLASVSASLAFPLIVFFLFPPDHWSFYALAVAVAVFLPITHRKNIQRLISGTESKMSYRKKSEKQSEKQ